MTRASTGRDDEEEMRSLKEGDVYVREDGKRFKVHKTVLPQKSGGGPTGYGEIGISYLGSLSLFCHSIKVIPMTGH